MERRRLDILIKLLDRHGRLIGVVGIENKVWSGEQHNQLKDYQTALCDVFCGVPKILLFLTPDERAPMTDVGRSWISTTWRNWRN
jgi:PD-(D/E)XK nuclease superfamily